MAGSGSRNRNYLIAGASSRQQKQRQDYRAGAPKAVAAQTVATIKKLPTLELTGSIEAVQEAVISAQVAGQVAGVPG